MKTLTQQNIRRYAVMQRINDKPTQVGIVTAINLTAATTKALRMYNRRVWVQHLETPATQSYAN